MASTLVFSRFDALLVALRGIGEHPEHVDVGPWRYSYRPEGAVAVWRHKDDWDRTVVVRPISVSAVGVEAEGKDRTWAYHPANEQEAIEWAIEWMKEHD